MKKLRQFLQSVLFINFMVGIYDGMRAKNLVAILINGVVVPVSYTHLTLPTTNFV